MGDEGRGSVLCIVGATATGKTEVALDLAEQFGAEIVSADSMQVYRHMDIGTAKLPVEGRRGIPHHLIDVADPTDDFTVYDYSRLARQAISGIHSRGRPALVVGGTGLYVRALTDGLDFSQTPQDPSLRAKLRELSLERGAPFLHALLREKDRAAAEKLHPNDVRRVIRALEIVMATGRPLGENLGMIPPPYRLGMIGLDRERSALYRRIDRRVESMVRDGLVREVSQLRERGCTREHRSMQAIGYKEMFDVLDGVRSLPDAVREIQRASRRYAKRQLSWFRADARIRWYLLTEDDMMGVAQEGDVREKLAKELAHWLRNSGATAMQATDPAG